MVSVLLTCLAALAELRFVSAVLGVSVDGDGFALEADFLTGGVFFAVGDGFETPALRVFMLVILTVKNP